MARTQEPSFSQSHAFFGCLPGTLRPSRRLSFMRFLGLGLTDRVPDAKTIWAFRERLTKAGAIEALFIRFDLAIREGKRGRPQSEAWIFACPCPTTDSAEQ